LRLSSLYRYALLAVLMALLAGIASACTAGGSPSASTGKSTGTGKSAGPIVGIADNSLLGAPAEEQATQFSAMKSAGIASVRVDADWSTVQPTGPSRFKWSALDQEVKSIRATGMSVDLIIDGCPPWASIPAARSAEFGQPRSAAEYAAWAAAVASRYRGMGVKYFEIWNEPNINQFWRPQPDPAAYTADLVAAYAAIKKEDPAAIVISGGLAPASDNGINYNAVTFVANMYADGAKGSFDYLGIHPYSYPLLPDNDDPDSAWSQMYKTNPSIRSVMTANGDGAKKIWITEFGAPSEGRAGLSPAAQGETITQALAAADKMDWIGAIYIYTWRDGTSKSAGSFGIKSADGSPKPAYYALLAALRDKTE
jgi:polysaccharide biosynthesis protein PslG